MGKGVGDGANGYLLFHLRILRARVCDICLGLAVLALRRAGEVFVREEVLQLGALRAVLRQWLPSEGVNDDEET
jgi:hypothetical protein